MSLRQALAGQWLRDQAAVARRLAADPLGQPEATPLSASAERPRTPSANRAAWRASKSAGVVEQASS